MAKICLIILFNFAYPANLEKLRYLYQNRFSEVKFLLPFEKVDAPDVITTYHNNPLFHGYLATAFDQIYQKDYTHYLVIGDDLLLHPDINEQTLLEKLNLTQDEAFISEFNHLGHYSWFWPHQEHIKNYSQLEQCYQQYANYRAYLPSPAECMDRYQRLGLGAPPSLLESLLKPRYSLLEPYFKGKPILKSLLKTILMNPTWLIRNYRTQRWLQQCLPIPLVAGYSDLVLCPAAGFERFSLLCGLFAAVNLWVEAAIPTALALSQPKIKTLRDTPYSARVLWKARKDFEAKIATYPDINTLYENEYSAETLYIHPIKLSRLNFEPPPAIQSELPPNPPTLL